MRALGGIRPEDVWAAHVKGAIGDTPPASVALKLRLL